MPGNVSCNRPLNDDFIFKQLPQLHITAIKKWQATAISGVYLAFVTFRLCSLTPARPCEVKTSRIAASARGHARGTREPRVCHPNVALWRNTRSMSVGNIIRITLFIARQKRIWPLSFSSDLLERLSSTSRRIVMRKRWKVATRVCRCTRDTAAMLLSQLLILANYILDAQRHVDDSSAKPWHFSEFS